MLISIGAELLLLLLLHCGRLGYRTSGSSMAAPTSRDPSADTDTDAPVTFKKKP